MPTSERPHVTYILIEPGRVPRIVREHITPSNVADAVGGTAAGLLSPDLEMSIFVRETAADDGSEYNTTGAIFVSTMARMALPLRGPVIIGSLHTSELSAGTAYRPSCFSKEEVEMVHEATLGAHLALTGEEWPEHIRTSVSFLGIAEDGFRREIRGDSARLSACSLPEGFPYPAGGQRVWRNPAGDVLHVIDQHDAMSRERADAVLDKMRTAGWN